MQIWYYKKTYFLFLCLMTGVVFVMLGPMDQRSTLFAVFQPGSDKKHLHYVVNTPGCKIQNLDPFDPILEGLVWKSPELNCALNFNSTMTYQDGIWLRINRTTVNQTSSGVFDHCRYAVITRVPSSDSTIDISKDSVRFETDEKMKDEFVKVECYDHDGSIIYENLHAFIIPKSQVLRRYEEKFTTYKRKYGLQKPLNVILLGTDSTSRLNTIRQLPKTREFLLEGLGGVEMMGYTKVGYNTFVNVVPLLVGKYRDELGEESEVNQKPLDVYDFIWKHFAEMGFQTLLAEDDPSIAAFNYIKAGFRDPPTDYYFRPYSLAINREKQLWIDKCFSGRSELEIILDWLSDFLDMCDGKPHFVYTFATTFTHDYINMLGMLDGIYFNFLNYLKLRGHLENAVLIFFSDHGMRWGDVRNTYIGKLEERLPMMYIAVPEWFKRKYPLLTQNLYSNSHKLTTPFDVHETLMDILYMGNTTERPKPDMTDRGMSLFSDIPAERSCEHATISPEWCTCHSQTSIPINSTISLRVARHIVGQMNNLTRSSRQMCAKLDIFDIKKAWRIVLNSDAMGSGQNLTSESRSVVDYQITLLTTPGQGLFESTVRHFETDGRLKVIGVINRISLYGTQSHCVGSLVLKPYCYCV